MSLGTHSPLEKEQGQYLSVSMEGAENTQFCHLQNFKSCLGCSPVDTTLVPFPFSAGLEPWSSFQPPGHIHHFCLADQVL